MKEFVKNNKITYNLMSFTGFKSLLVFSLLVESPKSYQEISDYMFNHPCLREHISPDTLRVYFNSLRRIGCEIKKVRGDKDGLKFTITNNPLKINVTDEQFNGILRTYRNLAKIITLHELLTIERFLRKIVHYINNENAFALLEKKSVLKGIDPDFLAQLVKHADERNQIVIEYNSPNSGRKFIELLAEHIAFTNNTFYLYGTSLEHCSYSSWLINRIVEVSAVRKQRTIPIGLKEITVGFELTGYTSSELDACVKVLDINDENMLAEITSSNKFDITQRLLEFGGDCKILYPQDFKDEFIKTLKKMRQEYDE